MKFNYNFHICPICSEKMDFKIQSGTVGHCPNGCCHYDVDPQGETVYAEIFDEKRRYCIGLYPKTWHKEDIQQELHYDLGRFMERIEYWKQDNQYLKKIEEYKRKNGDNKREKLEAFDYDFDFCPICDNELKYDEYELEGACPNRCCQYEIDPQGETVVARLFDNKWHFILLGEDSVNKKYNVSGIDWDKSLKDFLDDVNYWRENNRYLEKIKEKND